MLSFISKLNSLPQELKDQIHTHVVRKVKFTELDEKMRIQMRYEPDDNEQSPEH